ncbi:DDE-type integrase/transposase/recombinase [Paraeggerthella sp. Marseille-Q4926]|uniref:DDE-type integrase/transposase/recombinase n=1 Tax=Paraeggerthella sp. Marseille-Q4926 TaxID=2866587 RepID=UPI00351DA890
MRRIAYLRTGRGRLCPATVIDLRTCMAVAWPLSERVAAEVAASTLSMAKARGYVAGNAIFRSNRGGRYASRLMAEWVAANDARLSVGRTGSCHDDAAAESFFATLKNEMRSLRSWPTRAEARSAVVGCIEGFYNRARPHSMIGY